MLILFSINLVKFKFLWLYINTFPPHIIIFFGQPHHYILAGRTCLRGLPLICLATD